MSERSVTILFFFNDTATTEIYTLSLHDALPISGYGPMIEEDKFLDHLGRKPPVIFETHAPHSRILALSRSEEHTSELQSRQYLVCRLLLEKKKNNHPFHPMTPSCRLFPLSRSSL